MAEIDGLGVHPVTSGPLPDSVQDVLAGHVARQELIVEAALTGRREPALSALTTDPLVRNPLIAERMLDELLDANAHAIDSDGTF
jgi:alpha-galactosidase/6-phospho-beta-glucosidase family protein